MYRKVNPMWLKKSPSRSRVLTVLFVAISSSSLLAQQPDINKYYTIESVSRVGQVLDVHASNTQPGTNVSLYGKTRTANQQWRFVPAGGGYYFIESKLGAGLILDIDNWGKNDQTNIHIVRKGTGTSAQKFKIVPAGKSTYYLESAMGKQFRLGVSNDGVNVVSRVGNPGNRIAFRFDPPLGSNNGAVNPAPATASPIRIMTYNTFLIPTSFRDDLGNGYKGKVKLNTEQRAAMISQADFLKGHDLLILNELFLNNQAQTVLNGLDSFYPHRTPVIGRSSDGWHSTSGRNPDSAALNGGVAILSKWPIEEKSQHIFNSACEEDKQAAKGFAYVRVNRNGEKLHLIGTHLQAVATTGLPPSCSPGTPGRNKEGWKVRQDQLREIRQFIDNKGIPSNEIVFIGGDLNIVQSMPEYADMLNILQASAPAGFTGHPVTYDPRNSIIDSPDQYGELLDYVLIDRRHKSPGNWYNHVLVPKINSPLYRDADYSDHYPVIATAKALGLPATKQKTYVAELKTGTKSGAGTDSNISLTLHGANGPSRTIKLNGYLSGNAFENGDVDVLDLCLDDVGTVSRLTVSSDNTYAASDWYLESITIVDGQRRDYFPCNNWLTSETPSRSLSVGSSPKNYDVAVKTGDLSGAGTDSNIYLTIHGDKGSTPEIRLNGYISRNAFENDQKDMVYLKNQKDVGTPTRVTIRSDDKYAGSGWYLDYVVVNGRRARFSRWLESGKLTATATLAN